MDKLIVEGKVVQRAECCPNNSTLYSQIKKEAISEAGKPLRQMQRLDKHVKTFKPIANHAANLEHERRKKVDGKKNLADALTKHVGISELEQHVEGTGGKVEKGRHELAPEIEE